MHRMGEFSCLNNLYDAQSKEKATKVQEPLVSFCGKCHECIRINGIMIQLGLRVRQRLASQAVHVLLSIQSLECLSEST